jgi:hypothetical protein
MITGRLPAGAGTLSAVISLTFLASGLASSEEALAAAPPAREVRKNFLRVQIPIGVSFALAAVENGFDGYLIYENGLVLFKYFIRRF